MFAEEFFFKVHLFSCVVWSWIDDTECVEVELFIETNNFIYQKADDKQRMSFM